MNLFFFGISFNCLKGEEISTKRNSAPTSRTVYRPQTEGSNVVVVGKVLWWPWNIDWHQQGTRCSGGKEKRNQHRWTASCGIVCGMERESRKIKSLTWKRCRIWAARLWVEMWTSRASPQNGEGKKRVRIVQGNHLKCNLSFLCVWRLVGWWTISYSVIWLGWGVYRVCWLSRTFNLGDVAW